MTNQGCQQNVLHVTVVVICLSHTSLLDLLAELGLGNLLHLGEDHGGDLLGGESVLSTEVVDLNLGGTIVVDNLEGPRLDILLDGWVIEAATNETPRVDKSVNHITTCV